MHLKMNSSTMLFYPTVHEISSISTSGWHLRNGPLGVKSANFIPANATSHNRHVIQVRRCTHCGERGIGTMLDEFHVHMPFPDLNHGLLLRRKIALISWPRLIGSASGEWPLSVELTLSSPVLPMK